MKRKLKRLVILALALTLAMALLCTGVNAAVVTGLKDIPGDGQYMSDTYVENYAIDSEKLGLLDSFEKIGLGVVNVLFSLCRYIVFLGLRVFRFALTLNVATLAGGKLDEIQTAMKNTIFEPMWIVAFIGVAAAMVRKFARRNFTGILSDIAKVVVIYMFVTLLATHTSEVLGNVVSISRDLGLSVVMEMNGRDADAAPDTFVDETVGILWGDLVHRPWEQLEFEGYSHTAEDARAILKHKPGSDERQGAVDEYIKAHSGAMQKGGSWGRIAVVLLYMLATLLKLAVYVACSLLVLVFQLLAMFHSVTGIIILLLAMFDSLGGVHLIGDWLKRMLETQIMTLITTILLGFIIWLGGVLEGVSGEFGWLGGIIIQGLVIVLLFLFRKQVLHGFKAITENPRGSARKLAGASALDIAAELPAAYAGAYLGSGAQGARMTRLDRKEQKSRIAANYAQRDMYGSENERATAERDLALKRQVTEDYRIAEAEARQQKRREKEEAQKQKEAERAAREEAKAKAQAQEPEPNPYDADAERPTIIALPPHKLPEPEQAEQTEPEVERPVTVKEPARPPEPPEAPDQERSVPHTDHPVTRTIEADTVTPDAAAAEGERPQTVPPHVAPASPRNVSQAQDAPEQAASLQRPTTTSKAPENALQGVQARQEPIRASQPSQTQARPSTPTQGALGREYDVPEQTASGQRPTTTPKTAENAPASAQERQEPARASQPSQTQTKPSAPARDALRAEYETPEQKESIERPYLAEKEERTEQATQGEGGERQEEKPNVRPAENRKAAERKVAAPPAAVVKDDTPHDESKSEEEERPLAESVAAEMEVTETNESD